MVALLILFYMALFIYIAFDIVVAIYMKWTGKSKEQARRVIHRVIHNFFCSNDAYAIKNDMTINDMMWQVVKTVIGNERFSKLQEISEDLLLMNYDETSGIPCLQYSMDIKEEEKRIIQECMKSRLQKKLELHNLPTKILVCWGFNEKADMPCLCLYYAETAEQYDLLCRMARQEHNDAPRQGKVLVDKDV